MLDKKLYIILVILMILIISIILVFTSDKIHKKENNILPEKTYEKENDIKEENKNDELTWYLLPTGAEPLKENYEICLTGVKKNDKCYKKDETCYVGEDTGVVLICQDKKWAEKQQNYPVP